MTKFVVVGAGATGLAAAYLLARTGQQVIVIEASERAGGLLATFDVGDGARLEHFYHHFFTHDAEINWLLEELGLTSQVRFRPTTMGFYSGGAVYDFNGIADLLRFSPISLTARLQFGFSSALLSYRSHYSSDEGTSALSWFRRWAGASASRTIWQPMLEVKFGRAAERIPLAWMAGRLRQRVRSRSRTQEKLGYLEGSLQVLVDCWVEELRSLGVVLQLGTSIDRFLIDDGRVGGVATSCGEVSADRVLSTIPTPILADVLEGDAPKYAARLRQVSYIGAICTVLSLDEPLSSVYWLNVADRGFDFGGVIEQTNLVPSEHYGGQHLAYLSRYLEWSDPLWVMDDAQLLDRQLNQLGRIFKRDVRKILRRHWIFRGKFAAPIADLNFSQRIPKYVSPLPNLFVAAMPHVYPDERSVNNSIRVAAEAVSAMKVDTSYVPRNISLAGRYGHANE